MSVRDDRALQAAGSPASSPENAANGSSEYTTLVALQRQVDLLTRLTDEIPGMVFQYRKMPDGQSLFPYASAGIQAVLGIVPDDVVINAAKFDDIIHPDDLQAFRDSFTRSATYLEPWRHEFRVLPPAQGLRWVRGNAQPQRLDDGSTLWYGFMAEITERKDIEAELQRLAATDYLTGLPNRRSFMARIEAELSRLRSDRRKPAAVIMVDLDHFKETNDQYGHASGDRVLRHFVKVLRTCLRSTDVAGRMGGEEFAIMLPGSDQLEAATFSKRLQARLESTPFLDGNACIAVSVSIGITIMAADDVTVEESLARSDRALYLAKGNGRNRIECI